MGGRFIIEKSPKISCSVGKQNNETSWLGIYVALVKENLGMREHSLCCHYFKVNGVKSTPDAAFRTVVF